ncbi:hypothetical protein TGMAS_313673 [Toxoplasma gondii MAS]|uniref:Uncharacterized protein n=1 Tax=Toxoplasma gondii MAS TaxID=943118 RepID=A0A086QYS2_TOXGO|nr:hypothetical protein TGMAS_313673 [Toxoplasma gondii MAS]
MKTGLFSPTTSLEILYGDSVSGLYLRRRRVKATSIKQRAVLVRPPESSHRHRRLSLRPSRPSHISGCGYCSSERKREAITDGFHLVSQETEETLKYLSKESRHRVRSLGRG